MNGLFVLKDDETVVWLLLNDEGINGGGNVEPEVNVGLFEVVNCSSVGGLVVLTNGFGVRDGVTPNGLVSEKKRKRFEENEENVLLFGSVTNWSKLTNVLNLSPRKLSGVLREADNEEVDTGLELIGFEFIPLATVG